ncbi:MAG: tRNA (adenosine(37)-N6)-threonylcarbamoyltransferase complex transferase subunit TsaD [Patescibacteria group bacterium]|nr:tRNA (adenosine(37)-N6)-threonylcarbamoyltransferase complex transferase subunit TsaD [Patescibacteria group bacterium]
MLQRCQKNSATIRILGIETSCDETSVALLNVQRTTYNVPRSKNNVVCGTKYDVRLEKHLISTQIPIHARYGGVVPEIAARTHVAEVISLLEKTLGWSHNVTRDTRHVDSDPSRVTSHESQETFDAIAVTQGPGLATALRVGIEAAKTLAWAYNKPLLPINHLEGHLASAWLVPANRQDWKFPILFLLVSGGHTELVLMKDFGSYKVLGRTRDDASGEAFDKTAKLLGLGYPGGPKLSQLASKGNPKAFVLPRPMIHDPSLDFSFSGLKTAVRQLIEARSSYLEARDGKIEIRDSAKRRFEIRGGTLEDMCASIQAAIVETLVAKTVRAAVKVRPRAVAVVGGVSANPKLKADLKAALKKNCPGIKLLAPARGLFTDNGAMIAAAGLWKIIKHKKALRWQALDAEPDKDL